MQMKMIPNKLEKNKKPKKFDLKKVRQLLDTEDDFIRRLFTTFDVPDSIEDVTIDAQFLLDSKTKPAKSKSATNRAQSVDELQERMATISNKLQSKKSKPSERTLKKRQAKKLKKDKEFKKRIISVTKSTKNEQIKEEKFMDDNKEQLKPAVFNENGKMVFSKFQFAATASKGKKSKKDKVEKNPKLVLQKLKKEKREIKELIEQGDDEKAKSLKQDLAWKKAFDKSSGKKVKDDTSMLLKTIKRRKTDKKKSKTDWKKRAEKVEKDKDSRQKKRQENIKKKSEEKKKHKLKKMAKRGRIIPGYG